MWLKTVMRLKTAMWLKFVMWLKKSCYLKSHVINKNYRHLQKRFLFRQLVLANFIDLSSMQYYK